MSRRLNDDAEDDTFDDGSYIADALDREPDDDAREALVPAMATHLKPHKIASASSGRRMRAIPMRRLNRWHGWHRRRRTLRQKDDRLGAAGLANRKDEKLDPVGKEDDADVDNDGDTDEQQTSI